MKKSILKSVKVIFIVVISLIPLLVLGVVGTLLYQKIKLERKDKVYIDKAISRFSPEMGKKRKFYKNVFSVKNLDEAPFLLNAEVLRKNIITSNDFINDSNSFGAFSAPLTEGMQKIAVDIVPVNEEFKLLNLEKNKVRPINSLVENFLTYKPSYIEAIVEDSAGVKYAMMDSSWQLYTNPAIRAYEATEKEERKSIQKFNKQLEIYKSNPNAEMKLKYCGAKTGQALFEKELHHFDVESRMNMVLKNVFNPNEIQVEKLPETQSGETQLICYKLQVNHMSTFLKASYLLPKTLYGFWDN